MRIIKRVWSLFWCERRSRRVHNLLGVVALMIIVWFSASALALDTAKESSLMSVDIQTIIMAQLKMIFWLFGTVMSLISFIFLFAVYDIKGSIRKLFDELNNKKDKKDCEREMDKMDI